MTPTPARPLGVAVIGHSFMGRAHSNAWRNVGAFFPDLPPVAQVVLAGRDPQRTAEAAGVLGWRESVTDWQATIAHPDVDIVDVCTPGHLHAEVTLAALAAGKHVLVEKPLANTPEEAEAMERAAEDAVSAGQVAMVGFNYRRVPALALARELVGAGRLGQLREVRIAYLQDWLSDPQAPMAWRLRRSTAGSGVLGDLGSHAVDLLRWITGQEVASLLGHVRTFVPERRWPDGRTDEVDVDDAAWATLSLDGGAVASLEVSRMATGRKNALTLEFYGDRGALRFDVESLNTLSWYDATAEQGLRGFTDIVVTEPEHPGLAPWWPPGHILGWDHTFTAQAAAFLDAVATGTPATPSFADGLAVQQVLGAVERSAATGGVVEPYAPAVVGAGS